MLTSVFNGVVVVPVLPVLPVLPVIPPPPPLLLGALLQPENTNAITENIIKSKEAFFCLFFIRYNFLRGTNQLFILSKY